jgi:alanine racemase
LHNLKEVSKAISGHLEVHYPLLDVNNFSFDTRRIFDGESTIFIALPGIDRDGHQFIKEAYLKGVRNFLVHQGYKIEFFDANYLVVDDVLQGLWAWAKHHRDKLSGTKFIGITGSNGKTIVKEWLYQLLGMKYTVGKSPRSFNSKIGVPISILEIQPEDEIALIEVGISEAGEMEGLADILNPEIGIITNIGDAHDEGFNSKKDKLIEKLRLFKSCNKIIFHDDNILIKETIEEVYPDKTYLSWGADQKNVLKTVSSNASDTVFVYQKTTYHFHFSNPLPFVENLMHCITLALHFDIPIADIQDKIKVFDQLEMRLEHIQAIDNSIIINDAYILDQSSLKLSLDHLIQTAEGRKTALILSDFPKSLSVNEWNNIEKLLEIYPLSRIITVGEEINGLKSITKDRSHFTTTEELYEKVLEFDWRDFSILLKGARKYSLDILVPRLERKSHSASLEINLSAISYNINVFKKSLSEGTALITVIKASVYGGGIEKLARTIANHDPAFIAVAYIDEGIELRKSGISERIIILNPDPQKIKLAYAFQLELEVYSLDLLEKICIYSQSNEITPIHLKIDTGMHRLGFLESDIPALINMLLENSHLKIATIFSHLSGSEDCNLDGYTRHQIDKFIRLHKIIEQSLNIKLPRHILNSEGIVRFPDFHFEYVRLGLGMYGISSSMGPQLMKTHALYAQIIHIKNIKGGESIGYGRAEYLKRDTTIGVVNIGYADGIMRSLSSANGKFWYKNQLVPILGNVCMDLTMIDLTNIANPLVGDKVEIFGLNHSIEALAKEAGTIPYEILTRLSSRIVRKYTVDY